MNLFRREAATECSPGRQPWEDVEWIEKPQKGPQNVAISGLLAAINSDPGLTPRATVVDAASRLDCRRVSPFTASPLQ